MRHLNLKKNIVFSLAEVVLYTFALFFLYKMIVAQVGIEGIGIWSLLLASTAAARLADIGFANGLNRYIAAERAKNTPEGAIRYLNTAMISMAVFYGSITLVMYGVLLALCPVILPDVAHQALFKATLPYACASFVMLNLSSTVMGAVTGLQRTDLKSLCALGGMALQILVAWLCLPLLGLKGAALGQLAQYGFMVVAGWVILRRYLPTLGLVPTGWDKTTFREMLNFGVKLQVNSIANFFFEPLTKFIMARMGGVDVLGYYEMAYRMVTQARSVIIAGYQTLVPAYADLKARRDTASMQKLIGRAERIMLLLAPASMLGLAAGSPVIAWLWLGEIPRLFIDFTLLITTGWMVNMLVAPSYLLAVAVGKLNGNMAGAVLTAALAPVLGGGLGWLYGGIGVATGAMLALIVGGALTYAMNMGMLKPERE